MLNEIQKKILQTVADMAAIPTGAVNIRSDGQKAYRHNSEHIRIESKTCLLYTSRSGLTLGAKAFDGTALQKRRKIIFMWPREALHCVQLCLQMSLLVHLELIKNLLWVRQRICHGADGLIFQRQLLFCLGAIAVILSGKPVQLF